MEVNELNTKAAGIVWYAYDEIVNRMDALLVEARNAALEEAAKEAQYYDSEDGLAIAALIRALKHTEQP